MNDSSFTKFDFNNDFFEVVPKGGVAAKNTPPPPKAKAPRTFKEAGEQGYEKGLLQGRAEGQKEAEKNATERFNQQAQSLQQSIENLVTSHEKSLEDLEHNMLGLFRFSLAKVISHAQTYYTEEILKTHIQDILQEAQETQNLTLKIHPNATPVHQEILAGNNPTTAGKNIRIKGDDTLGPADVILEWPTGGLEKAIPHMFKRLDTLLQSTGAVTPRQNFTPTEVATPTEQDRIAALLGDDDDLVPELQETTPTQEDAASNSPDSDEILASASKTT